MLKGEGTNMVKRNGTHRCNNHEDIHCGIESEKGDVSLVVQESYLDILRRGKDIYVGTWMTVGWKMLM